MIEVYVLFFLALVWIVFAVVQDIRTREIANWLNFSLVIFALGFRFFYSLFSEAGFSFFYQGLIGFLIFLALGNVFYYGRMFAGGDAKLMMALGAVLPIYPGFFQNLELMFLFLALFLVVGAVYGIFSSIFFTLVNLKIFRKEFMKQFKKKKRIIGIFSLFSTLFLALSFFNQKMFYFGIFIFVMPYFYLWVKSVDESCMVRKIKTSRLTIGDWLYQDEKIGKKIIKANWEGVSEKEISFLKKHKREILVRYGIQFAPVFLISFLLLVFAIKLDLLSVFMGFF